MSAAAAPTRDQIISSSISGAESTVAELVQVLGGLVEHATADAAVAHAALYEQVQGCLASAEKQLGRAYDIMLNGEPDDFLT